MTKIWISCGELSGDLQASEILKELKKQNPDITALGMGGDNLEKAGMDCLFRIEELSVMGIAEVLMCLPKILKLLKRIEKSLETHRPDALILVDCPDFNFRIARMAHKLNIPIYYFIPPKVWAWRKGRIHFLKQYVSKILSILPFEVDFYKKHNVAIEYVGNPLVSLINYEKVDTISADPNRLGLLPGSRKRELSALLPEFSKTADILAVSNPSIEFHLLKAPTISEDFIKSLWTSKQKLIIHDTAERYAFMASCHCTLAASGTAVLETALVGVPTVVSYKVSPFSYLIAKLFVDIKWASLPNIISQKEVFPEYLQEEAKAELFAQKLSTWFSHSSDFERVQSDCKNLRLLCGTEKSAEKAAQILIADLINKK